MIRKTDQHAFSQRFGVELIDSLIDPEPFSLRNVDKLPVNLRDLL
jgi:hypothetical protein